MTNLFDDVPVGADDEIFTEILSREDIRIERIVSTGQVTPAENPHRQGHDEWVLLLAGSAGLRIEGEDERNLRPARSCFDRSSPSPLGNLDRKGQTDRVARRALRVSLLPI